MLYAILIHAHEAVVDGRTPQEQEAMLAQHAQLREELSAAGRLGPSLRLGPTASARVVRGKTGAIVTDGPFAETKEQLLGLYIVDCATPEDAVAVARQLAFDTTAIEIRPIAILQPGGLAAT